MFKKKNKKQPKKPTTTWGKIWFFIWHDNSIASWLVNIVLAFILIKFIVYPGLGLIFGTALPVVAVVSESMDHSYEYDVCLNSYKLCEDVLTQKPSGFSGFDDYWTMCGGWYESNGVTKEEFQTFPIKNGFSKGDIIVLFGKDPEKIKVGDIIVFQSREAYPIIHRVVDKRLENGKYLFETKGDHNHDQIVRTISGIDVLNEQNVHQDQIIGVAAIKIPLLGWIKVGASEVLQGKPTCSR